MKRWTGPFCYAACLLLALLMYLVRPDHATMAGVLLVLALALYAREPSRLAVVYLGLVVNVLFLVLALVLTEGRISYLTDDEFTSYYAKALLLETAFWASLGCFVELRPRRSRPVAAETTPLRLRMPPHWLTLTAIVVLMTEMALSSGSYFAQYAEVSDTGTIAYEVGCLLVALSVVYRSTSRTGRGALLLEVFAVGIALFIALASGKRLPLAFVIVAYMLLSLKTHGKARTLLLFIGISVVGYGFGIVRDFMTLSGVDAALLSEGFGSTNQGAVLHASAVYVRIADEGLSTVGDRLVSFLSNFIGALVLPLSLLPPQAQVNMHAMPFYTVQGNGGFVSSYAYFFLGLLGPFVVAGIVAFLLHRRGRWMRVAGIVIVLTSPRWILYNIGPVARLISLTLLILMVLELLSSSSRRSFTASSGALKPPNPSAPPASLHA